MGLSGHKPWECVGEIAESGAALPRLARNDLNGRVAAATNSRAGATRSNPLMPNWQEIWDELMIPSPDHAFAASLCRSFSMPMSGQGRAPSPSGAMAAKR